MTRFEFSNVAVFSTRKRPLFGTGSAARTMGYRKIMTEVGRAIRAGNACDLTYHYMHPLHWNRIQLVSGWIDLAECKKRPRRKKCLTD